MKRFNLSILIFFLIFFANCSDNNEVNEAESTVETTIEEQVEEIKEPDNNIWVSAKKGDIESIRKLTKTVIDQSDSISDVWKLLAESALCEGRQGFKTSARKQFTYLIK